VRSNTQPLRRLVLAWVCALLLPGAAQGAGPERYPQRYLPPGSTLPAIPEARAVPPTSVLGIISGGLSGTYIRIATDIASVFDARAPQLRILPIVGKGSLQNISDILNIRDVDIGIVQSDVLSFLRTRASASLESSVAYLAKLYDEEVHILVRPEITTPADLAGKKVNVDSRGSGTALTAFIIFDALGVKIEPANDDQETALAKLKRGEIAGLVYVTGKPARLFIDAAGSNLHLLALPLDPTLLETYLPSRFEHADYPGLVPEGQTVETVAVGAVMAVYNWAPGSERYTRIARFVDAFFDNMPTLQTPGRHPKWREVSLAAQVPGWTRFRAAQLWLQRHAGGQGAPNASRQ
jgi:TRAP transporter TAXI family solute receptor